MTVDTPVTWLAIREDQKAFEDQQLRALRAAFPDLVDASPAQLGIFFHYCKASGLDPFGRQIYMIKRKSRGEVRWTIQTGIDGYRLIARRAADRAGQSIAYEDFVWYDAEGGEHAVWLRDEPPVACRVVIWRGEARFPAVAHWREYAPKVWDYEAQEYKLGGLWPQMPASQFGKVAEALSLRRACPADLSGLHVDEEMHAADAAESRERVKEAAARLRSPDEQQANGGSPAQPTSDVVDAEIVESQTANTDAAAPQEEQRADKAAEPPASGRTDEVDRVRERMSALDQERSRLEEARARIRETADRLALGFDTVNDRCFDAFGTSFQDASAEQLSELNDSLTPAAGTSDEPATAGRRNGSARRTRTPAKKAAASAKKKTARKATDGTTSPTRVSK
ncbi:DNA single-strand annealing protein RecT-like protein [Actinobacteria bacterium OK074]|nr:DNA single-strand annealing protein RecT-like protein [Actinobacteria bacterium OK074]